MTQSIPQLPSIDQENVSLSAKIMSAYLYIFLVGSIYGNYASANLNQFVLWILGPAVLFFVVSKNISKISKLPTEIKLFGALLPIALFGLVNAEDSDGFFRYYKVIFSNLFLMIMVYVSVERKSEIKVLLQALFLACMTVVFLSVFIKDTSQDVSDEYYRLTGITGNANGLATFSRIGVLLALYNLLVSKKIVKKAIYLGLIVACLNIIILTASRGAFANIILSLAIFFIFRKLSGVRLILAFFIAYILYLSFLTFGESLFGETYLYKRITRNETVTDAVESEARINLYIKTFDLFLENPIFGVGLNQIKQKLGSISHSDLLDIAAQTGILGLIAYMSIYIKLFRRIIKNWTTNNLVNNNVSSTFFITLFISEIIYGISNPNWFSQINMFVLAIIVTNYVAVEKHVSFLRRKSLTRKSPSAFIPN